MFWNTDIAKANNTKARHINACLIEMLDEYGVDLLILAEYGDDLQKLCDEVSFGKSDGYKLIPNDGGCERIKGIIKSDYTIESLCESTHYQIVEITVGSSNMLIAMVHNISKTHSLPGLQKETLRQFHYDIIECEGVQGCCNTLAIGDYNVNPFEEACISAAFMHSIPYCEEAARRPGKRYPHKFYNPTWKFFGAREVPYTTYHYNKGDIMKYYWNAYDQVMIRPCLMSLFDENELKIITHTENHNLLYRGKPYRKMYSDHLPLFCKVKEESEI